MSFNTLLGTSLTATVMPVKRKAFKTIWYSLSNLLHERRPLDYVLSWINCMFMLQMIKAWVEIKASPRLVYFHKG